MNLLVSLLVNMIEAFFQKKNEPNQLQEGGGTWGDGGGAFGHFPNFQFQSQKREIIV